MIRPDFADTSDSVRSRMFSQKTLGTTPETHLRRALFEMGLRYRVEYPVPGSPRRSIDIAFTKHRLAVFVDGCFWHRCPVHSVPAKTNSLWWNQKLEANAVRDADTNDKLVNQGWQVLRFWEHEDLDEAARTVQGAIPTKHEA